MNDLEWLGWVFLVWFTAMSVILFFVMRHDKRLSHTHKRRISERRLFLLAIFGGALGGVLGMQIFRHKTQHKKFILGFPLLALVQWGVTLWLLLPPDMIEKV